MANEFNTIGLPTITGNEVITVSVANAGTPTAEGWGMFTPLYNIRNSAANTIVTSTAATVTTVMTTLQSVLIWHSTAPTNWVITLPPAPTDGAVVEIGTDTTLTTLVTVNAASGDSLQASFSAQTINAKASNQWVYNRASAVWYQFR